MSSAPDDESAGSGSPDEPRSVAHSEDPPSVFASGDVTPTDPRTDPVLVTCDGADSDEDAASARGTLTREQSTTKDSPASNVSCKIGELPIGAAAAQKVDQGPAETPAPLAAEVSVLQEAPAPTVPVAEALSPPAPPAPVAEPPAPPAPVAEPPAPRAPVAPLAVCEDIGVDDDNADKVPSAPLQRVSAVTEAACKSDATKQIAHGDELSSVSESNIVKRDNKSVIGERKQRNDICPWEDE